MKIKGKMILFAVSAALGLMPLMNLANAQNNATSAQPWYNCRTRELWTLQKQAWCQKAERVKNMTYQLPNVGSVQLQNGSYQARTKGVTVTLIDKPGALAFTDINDDGNEDAVTVLVVNGTEAVYLSPVLNVASNPRNVNSVLLGDRVQVQSIVVNAGQIQANITKNNQALTQTYTISGNNLTLVSECLTATNERDSYSAINLEQINSELTGSNPREIAIAAFGIQEPQEGNFQQTVSVDDRNPQQVVVTMTQNNLPDDSVQDVRYRVEFEPVANQSQWRMVWAGRQQRCRQGRGSQNWTTEACL
ncbi:hypothetical protein [Chroogloeocystis siderophila]|jgi:hypothetical protein|uniref:hypothetical protein n=1 Tax=Chroogloeocystis siderophila TaxID=329163 RepID=UPI0009FC92BB|nr:hypothetical protein [Chroogloeocystis siderophila]